MVNRPRSTDLVDERTGEHYNFCDDARAEPPQPWRAPFFGVSEAYMSEKAQEAQLAKELDADIVNLSGGDIGTIEAEIVRIHQGGARRIVATDVGLRSGGAGVVTAESAGMQFSASMALRGDLVSMDRSAAGILMGERVALSNSASALTVAQNASLDGSSTVFLLAGNVEGPVKTVFDTRGSLLAGLTAGIAAALVLFVTRLLRDRS